MSKMEFLDPKKPRCSKSKNAYSFGGHLVHIHIPTDIPINCYIGLFVTSSALDKIVIQVQCHLSNAGLKEDEQLKTKF